MKKRRVCAVIGIGTILLFTVVGCSDSLSRTFYTHHPRSAQEVEMVWGKPVDVIRLDGGIEKRTYVIQSPYTDLKYRYFLIRDNVVLASGITDTAGAVPPKIQQENVGFVPSDLSKAYYARHKTTVAHLDQTWGKPLQVQDMNDGMQVRVYSIQDPYTDFKLRKFIVKDGIVVASRISPETEFSVDTRPQEYRSIEINEISHLYYQKHPMSLEAVEMAWGEPVLIQKADNGLEKRTYKLQIPTDAAFAFRFFIIKDGQVISSGISDTMDVSAK
ncbi:MAG: hypothetical protein KQI81_04965 [Deltaproteobacteria bacterium]|nr:hypothetical protein [Deltaproteobacteria bacterium]